MDRKTLHSLTRSEVAGRTVLVRLDLNAPLDEALVVSDDTRLEAVLPTLRVLRDLGARSVLLSHLGRPDGAPDPAFSLAPVARRLSELLGSPVGFVGSTTGPETEEATARMSDGDFLLLENTRFDPRETEDDASLAAEWAALGALYVNDAFGTAHRAHASTHALAKAVRERGGHAVAGLLMERELTYLGRLLGDPERPFVGILGGAKISGKIDVVESLLKRVDRLLVGGAMANTFLRALGLDVGASLVEDERVDLAADLLERAGERILLPVDGRVAPAIGPDATPEVRSRSEVGGADRIGDIGPATEALFADALRSARTIVWNGPMGVFECPPFAQGTLSVARAAATAADGGALVVLGGGDSASAAEVAGVSERLSHVSTGGGASLEFLAGRTLPGVEVLTPAGPEAGP